jgi:hypothetical protein
MRNEKREARSERRETRSEKRETRSEKREARNEKREARNENQEPRIKITPSYRQEKDSGAFLVPDADSVQYRRLFAPGHYPGKVEKKNFPILPTPGGVEF